MRNTTNSSPTRATTTKQKSVRKSATAKRSFATNPKKAGGIVSLIGSNKLCKRRRVAGGKYKRSSSCAADEKVRTTVKYNGRGTYTPSGGDAILNPKRGKSNKPRRRTVKR
jgi:hypothetical protein